MKAIIPLKRYAICTIRTYLVIVWITLTLAFSQCKLSNDKNTPTNTTLSSPEIPLIPINYEFDSIGLTLHSKIDRDFWKWNYLMANGSIPDTIGQEYYWNMGLPNFSYAGEETSPCLDIITIQNQISTFSATVLFNLEDHHRNSIEQLLDSLSMFDILDSKAVRAAILDSLNYRNRNDHAEETLILELKKPNEGYSSMTYSIESFQ